MPKLSHLAVLVGVGLVACSAGAISTTGSTLPEKQVEVTGPTSGLLVKASIVAATLADECAGSGAAKASGDCAGAPVASADGGTGIATGGCGFCQQSNVQISFSAGAGTGAARVEIVRVDLLDAAAGTVIDNLKPSKPQVWNGTGYATWDQTVKAASDTKTSYDLTAPAWSKINGSSTSRAYSTKYKLHVTLRIDGVEVILESNDLNREPQVAT